MCACCDMMVTWCAACRTRAVTAKEALNIQLCAGSFQLVGTGWCRGQDGAQKVNGRVKAGLIDDAACANACTVLNGCEGYAFAFKGEFVRRCYLHGKGLDKGLPLYAEPVSEIEWEGYTQPNLHIAAASGYSEARCFLQKGTCHPFWFGVLCWQLLQ